MPIINQRRTANTTIESLGAAKKDLSNVVSDSVPDSLIQAGMATKNNIDLAMPRIVKVTIPKTEWISSLNISDGLLPDENLTFQDIIFDNDEFIAIVSGSNVFYVSSNGIIWNKTYKFPNARDWSSIVNDRSKILVIAHDNYYAHGYTNNFNRFSEGIISNTVRDWSSVCYGNGYFVAVAKGSEYCAYWSGSGMWTEVAVSSTARDWSDVCFFKDKYIALAGTSDTIAYSNDRKTWNEVTLPSRDWKSLACNDNYIVVIANNSNLYEYSTDGITWNTGIISETPRSWNSICYGNNMFVAISTDGYCAYSVDGISWSEIAIDSKNYKAICNGKDKFVVVPSSSSNSLILSPKSGIVKIPLNIKSTDTVILYPDNDSIDNYSKNFVYLSGKEDGFIELSSTVPLNEDISISIEIWNSDNTVNI